jgi:hypothetical protein
VHNLSPRKLEDRERSPKLEFSMSMSTPLSETTASPLPSAQSYETVLGAIDLFIHKERAALQAEIRRLQAENAALLKGQSSSFAP